MATVRGTSVFFQRVTFRLIPHNVTLYNPAICDNWCRNHCMLPLHVTAEYSRCSLQQPRNCLVMDSASPNSPLATEEARGAPSYGSCWGAQFQVSCGAECTPNFIPGKRHSMVRRATRIEPAAVHHPRLEAPSHTCARRRPSLQYAELRPPWPRSPEQGRRSTFVWLSSRLLNANTPPANHPGDTSRASSATAAAIAS